MQYEHILKVMDIHYQEFSREFVGFIAQQLPTYKDMVMAEDLFSPDELREANSSLNPQIDAELTRIAKLMHQKGCGYFRIVYH